MWTDVTSGSKTYNQISNRSLLLSWLEVVFFSSSKIIRMAGIKERIEAEIGTQGPAEVRPSTLPAKMVPISYSGDLPTGLEGGVGPWSLGHGGEPDVAATNTLIASF